MKKLLLIPFLLMALSGFNQVILLAPKGKLVTLDTTTKHLNVIGTYLLAPNDSTINFDSSKVVTSMAKNAAGDSFYVYKGGSATPSIRLKDNGGTVIGGPVNRVLSNNTQISHTGTITEDTVYTGTIPGGSIGIDGSFHIIMTTTANNSVSSKRIKVYFYDSVGTPVVVNTDTYTTAVSHKTFTVISNRHSAISQVSLGAGTAANLAYYATSTATAISTYSFKTTADIRVAITMQNVTVSGDTMTLEAFEIIANY